MHALLDDVFRFLTLCDAEALYEAPLSRNTTLGGSANFTCNISGNIAVFWYVDGLFYKDITIVARGVSYEYDYDEVSDSTKSVLTVACGEQNNNTVLQCSGFDNGEFIESSTVLLRIQGVV